MYVLCDTDAQSYTNCIVGAILSSAEHEKKNKYTAAAEPRHATFTPFVVSVDGIFGREATCFLKITRSMTINTMIVCMHVLGDLFHSVHGLYITCSVTVASGKFVEFFF